MTLKSRATSLPASRTHPGGDLFVNPVSKSDGHCQVRLRVVDKDRSKDAGRRPSCSAQLCDSWENSARR